MTRGLSNFPAILYSGLWALKTLGLLKRDFSNENVRIIILITDEPPAFMLHIANGDFQVEILEDIVTVDDLNSVESDGYISLPSQIFLGGVEGVLEGIRNKLVTIKGEALIYLGKIGVAF
ncbi:MAG: hypothetical protein KGD73_06145 [Candidatus Lokiarchaeota archaeon]|nr:hypothetical protein [Candidatus Lokiarchaeota archaeon]